MRKDKITYLYICEDKHCKMFATFGNFRTGWNYPAGMFPMKNEENVTAAEKQYWTDTTFGGYISNISTSRLPDEFSVVHQIPYTKHYKTLVKQWKHIALTYGVNPDDAYLDLKSMFTEEDKMELLADLDGYNYLRKLNHMRPLEYKW